MAHALVDAGVYRDALAGNLRGKVVHQVSEHGDAATAS